jgi:hypothetical protein
MSGCRLVPGEPRFETASEEQVWSVLGAALPEHAVLIANLRITDETKDHEADLIVLMPGVGVVVVEVKGGSVWRDADGWHQALQSGKVPADRSCASGHGRRSTPCATTSNGTHGGGRAAGHGSCGRTPSSRRTPSSTTTSKRPSARGGRLHGKADLDDLAGRLRDTARRQVTNARPPSYDDVELIADILAGRNFGFRDVNAEADERTAQADRLTDEQAMILGVTRLLHRVEVRGGAGSGMTVLALAQAKDLTRGPRQRGPQTGRAPLLLDRVWRSTSSASCRAGRAGHRPAFVGTFRRARVVSWGAPDGDRTGQRVLGG